MKYICKLKVIDECDYTVPSFDLILKYKEEGRIFYKGVNLFSISIFSINENEDFNEVLLEYIRNMNSKSIDEWDEIISDRIRKEEGLKIKENSIKNNLDKEIKSLKQMTKKFEVIV